MNKLIYLPFFLFLSSAWLYGQESPVYFADYPALTPDGEIVVFSYEGDLWKVSAEGGLAARITAMEGVESHPQISPDGAWLAFTGRQYGNPDVFVMPLSGGAVRQLTYHEAADQADAWSWDSRKIYITSSRYNSMTTFQVAADGGTPKRLFSHYFNNVHNIAEHPTSGEVYFNESWESSRYTHRKGYRGDFNPDIKSYNSKTGAYKEYTDYEGKDFEAMIDRMGTLYFLSDEYNGEYNLYTFENGKKKRLTGFNSSIYHPAISADGNCIVFRKDYQLFIYDLNSRKSQKLDLRIVRNPTLAKSQDYNVKGKISAFDVSDDGKKMAFVSRGELFVSDVEGKFIRQLTTRSDGRVGEVHWLKDDKTILFNQTVGGYQNWFVQAAEGSRSERPVTDDAQNNRQLSFNSDKTKAVYLSGRNEVRLLDLESLESRLLTRDELWGLYSDRPFFAPDDRHIVFSAYRNFEEDIMVYDLETETVTNLTQTGVAESSPRWSPDGKYLYFSSNRTQPSYPFGLQEPNIYRMALQPYDKPYRSDKFEELFSEEADDAQGEEEEKEKPAVIIETRGLMERLERIGPSFGSQYLVKLIQKEDKTTVLFISDHEEGKYQLWKTDFEPFEKPKTEKIEGVRSSSVEIRRAKDQYYLLSGGDIHKFNIEDKKVDKIDLDYTFRRRLDDEFEQMFYETWANMEENFYDEEFHGVDWQDMRDRYARYLPHINNREDLRRVLNDMLGELNTSHFGFRSEGKEEEVQYGTRSLETGILFQEEDPYRVARVVRESPADRMDKNIQPGDRLLSVNGEKVDPSKNRETYFSKPSLDEEVVLTFRRGEEERTIKVHPVSYSTLRNLLYDEWEDACQARVDEGSDRHIAYVHMKNMGGGSLDRFLQEMVSEGHQRDALILDLRYNTGGNVHDKVLQFLSQRPYLKWQYRGGAMATQPNFAPAAKPIVLLINEPSLSDAEMTAAGFKELGLGTLIGTETYRWIIFTSGKSLVDGSFYRLPSWGCYTLDGENLEKTGVSPDIYVRNTFKDRLEGKDPQLDRAIDHLKEQLDKRVSGADSEGQGRGKR